MTASLAIFSIASAALLLVLLVDAAIARARPQAASGRRRARGGGQGALASRRAAAVSRRGSAREHPALASGPEVAATLAAAKAHERPRFAARALDPGRELRAERRARELLRSCVSDEEWEMYRDLGFLRVPGRRRKPGAPRYAYLVYPRKPIVAYFVATGEPIAEYCVEFPDIDGRPLPPSDDVLAKWMALTSDEELLLRRANMHLVGRHHDPARLRRDLWRLASWEKRRARRAAPGRRATRPAASERAPGANDSRSQRGGRRASDTAY